MAPPGTRVIVHDKPGKRTSWGNQDTPDWYIGTSLDHYRCMKCYMPATGILRIKHTLQYIPKAFAFPETTTEDYLQQAIGDIFEIMKDPPKTLPFFYYVYTKKGINIFLHILNRSTSQPRLQILPLQPLLPHTQSEKFNFKIPPAYQYELRGWNRFRILREC